MKQVSQNFMEEIRTLGNQQNVRISFTLDGVEQTLESEEVNSVTRFYQADLLKSVMVQLDVDSNINIPINTEINFEYGILINEEYEYIDYGNFIVYESNRKEDTESYEIRCYDKMLYSMKDYEPINITYPTTIQNYLTAICNRLGYTLQTVQLLNLSLTIPSDLYKNIGYTYRDVLDDIAEVLGCVIYIRDNGTPYLVLGKPTETSLTLDEESFKDVNVKFGEKYGPINSIVLSRSGESDNVYLKDDSNIEQNGLCEIKIIDNQIMNFNNRSDYLPGIADSLFGLEYYLNDYSSTGIMYLDLLDFYNVSIGENNYKCLMLNDEQDITQGLEEQVYTEKPETSETDYTKADKTDQKINQTYLIVDKQNQTIESVVSNVTEQNNKIARVEQTVDSLNSKISDIADITTSQETNTGSLSFESINQSEPIHIEIRATGENISYLYPFDLLYPSDDLFIKLRTLRFTNITTTEVFDYELPDDLLYYDSENYDTFVLDYDSQTVYVNKKCTRNWTTGAVEPLAQEVITQYPFPSIELTDGDYTVEMLKYDNTPYVCYLMVRLMSQNIYTTQFATRAEMNSKISQTSQEIEAGVNETLEDYATKTEMNAAIAIKANEINLEVEKKVNEEDFTGANIMLAINNDSSSATIDADKISLERKRNQFNSR